MQIEFYTVQDDPKTIPKTLTGGVLISGAIRDSSVDLMQPEITITGNVSAYNYMYIPDFHRYYFVEPPVTVRTGIQIVRGRVDVLQTYAPQIFNCPAVLDRSANLVDAFIADGQQERHSFPAQSVLPFNYLTYGNYIFMLTAG